MDSILHHNGHAGNPDAVNEAEIRGFFEALRDESTDDFYQPIIGFGPDGDRASGFAYSKDVDKIVSRIADQTLLGRNVYFGCGLLSTRPAAGKRGAAEDVVAVRGVQADIDIEGPAHKAKDLPKSEADAMKIINGFPLQPTIIVNSGHGLQVYWLFREPIIFESTEERDNFQRFAVAFHRTLGAIAKEAGGWKIDNVSDLARILRVPGSVNYKGEPVPVALIDIDDSRRYSVPDFEPYLREAPKAAAGDYGERLDVGAVLEGIQEGDRSNKLYSYAASCQARCIPREEATVLVCQAARNATPPFPVGEAEDMVQRVYNKYGDSRAIPHKPSRNGHGPEGPTDYAPVIRDRTDSANSERLADRLRGRAVYVHEAKSWYVFDGTRWVEDTHGYVRREAVTTARAILHEAAEEPNEEKRQLLVKWSKQSESQARKDAMIKDASAIEGMTVSATIFDKDPTLLACKNGTIDLTTGELRESRPEDYMSKASPYAFTGVDTQAPRWETFLSEILPDEEIRDYLQVAAGYGATGLSNARAFFICHGTGRNGKGTFLETVRNVLGDYGHTAQSQTFLVARREGGQASSDVADLKGTRFVITSESKKGAKIDANLIKSLTGDDTVNARHLFQRAIQFKPSWSVFFATNHRPELPGDDIALWERVKLIPFEVRIPDDKKDTSLKGKLAEEGSGILAWLVRGARYYIENGLSDPESVIAATAEYQAESDPIGDFIATYLDIHPGRTDRVTESSKLRDLWEAYQYDSEVADDLRYTAVTARLKADYGRSMFTSKSQTVKGKSVRVWTGFELNEAAKELVEDMPAGYRVSSF